MGEIDQFWAQNQHCFNFSLSLFILKLYLMTDISRRAKAIVSDFEGNSYYAQSKVNGSSGRTGVRRYFALVIIMNVIFTECKSQLL